VLGVNLFAELNPIAVNILAGLCIQRIRVSEQLEIVLVIIHEMFFAV
jgi:hypothetical protein